VEVIRGKHIKDDFETVKCGSSFVRLVVYDFGVTAYGNSRVKFG